MSTVEVVVPRLGESVIEATIIRWLKNEGEQVETEDALVEIATDKVDSEIVSTASGKLLKKLFNDGDVVAVGVAFALIMTEGEPGSTVTENTPDATTPQTEKEKSAAVPAVPSEPVSELQPENEKSAAVPAVPPEPVSEPQHETEEAAPSTRYYSPLVRSIAQQEGLSFKELDSISGRGKDDRLTKQDILEYITKRQSGSNQLPAFSPGEIKPGPAIPAFIKGDDRIVEMDRVRQLIANHMLRSVQTSPHVTSFIEVDMSRITAWRENNKHSFQKNYGEKLTFTPIFIEAISKAVRDYPMVNVSVDGNKVIIHSKVNVGMAVALPGGNLIVPVVRDAGSMNLLGITKAVNDLAERARNNKLVPDEITGGTISLTNLGSFGTLMGTPIINQPQAAIIAVGVIKKRPVVIESEEGDMIAIREVMIGSLTFDHRVIDGALGGQFLGRFAKYLEQFDINQTI